MTPAQKAAIRQRIDQLDPIIADLHDRVNEAAVYESLMASASPDGEYQNDALTDAKDALIELAGKLITATEALQQALTGADA